MYSNNGGVDIVWENGVTLCDSKVNCACDVVGCDITGKDLVVLCDMLGGRGGSRLMERGVKMN